jgi:hypothetical protein
VEWLWGRIYPVVRCATLHIGGTWKSRTHPPPGQEVVSEKKAAPRAAFAPWGGARVGSILYLKNLCRGVSLAFGGVDSV